MPSNMLVSPKAKGRHRMWHIQAIWFGVRQYDAVAVENLAKIIIAFACKFQYNAFLFIAAQVFVKRVGLQCTESVAPCPLDIWRYLDDCLLHCGTLHIGELALSLGFHKVIFRLCLLWVVGCGCSLIELLEGVSPGKSIVGVVVFVAIAVHGSLWPPGKRR